MKRRIEERKKVVTPFDDRYNQWKTFVPVLYDWFSSQKLDWPSLTCRWGPELDRHDGTYLQRLYLSEKTSALYNTLVVGECGVLEPTVAKADEVTMSLDEDHPEPPQYFEKNKIILHPGVVTRMREFPLKNTIMATHTNRNNEVLIWDLETQRNRGPILGQAIGLLDSNPDVVLTGHRDIAEYALDMSSLGPFVLSGGKDKCVVCWSIDDQVVEDLGTGRRHCIGPRGIYQGHADTVVDVQFYPRSAQQFCSVGDDSCLIFWDARIGHYPTTKVEKAHDGVRCVDWNRNDNNYILTGSADKTVKMLDCRNLRTSSGLVDPVHIFEGHDGPVLKVQWSPDYTYVFGSASEDGLLNIWDYVKVGASESAFSAVPKGSEQGLFFQHAGHRGKVVDFHWHPSDQWTIASVSVDAEDGGGTLQVWRIMEAICRPEMEVKAELNTLKFDPDDGLTINKL